ncbi:membrane protein insertion efficiency factor YidD [uncultured Maritalea sp.]|uniref:membrane protein insertion efficiency factor YidD n=1 Tax=uncultured Maritalea sp. TaxID=757249 RepID=UPI002617412D|nr:membrane protein insertion efficiency factor YidD [uncultured Maritalea sp.]
MLRTIGLIIDFPFKWTAVGLILIYRYSLSAFMGRTCRHAPSCSEFTMDAIKRYGFWSGGWMGAGRVYRCRPGGSDGFDPVPEKLPSNGRWYAPWRFGRWK